MIADHESRGRQVVALVHEGDGTTPTNSEVSYDEQEKAFRILARSDT